MINRALKTIRLYHNLKQSELADNLCISKSYLSEIESGKKTVSFDMLVKYSQEFNIPVSSLVFLSEEMNTSSNKTFASKFRSIFTERIFKIMEWSIERNESKKTKNKN
ncbi:helix-turn-helix domain-containing protein [Morganella morganii]|uniref:helix-turn-helix domain-containing protein n=1 Tax=Morganella TaxID=581 RepID=UPI0009496B47|nr:MULTISPECIES: helix-turn-helix transcriptional regulator [Morganella]SSN05975.1 Predicted transcriptional regulator [Klebsiella pneumoniae]EJD6110820.1 helix-turn-helix transcriptional regulator [Morganella morganii]EKU4014828.1 helix-turn-helix transcriptional regulator [Morganella morganii]ELA7701996.1 helix-turn-helix transcriptional regulator [Morganella morganii]EMB8444539.1 helix-turn-helix transcriptional regulator [Morganella morganii]